MAKLRFTPDDAPGPQEVKIRNHPEPTDDTEGHKALKFRDEPGPSEQAKARLVEPTDDDTEGHAHQR